MLMIFEGTENGWTVTASSSFHRLWRETTRFRLTISEPMDLHTFWGWVQDDAAELVDLGAFFIDRVRQSTFSFFFIFFHFCIFVLLSVLKRH